MTGRIVAALAAVMLAAVVLLGAGGCSPATGEPAVGPSTRPAPRPGATWQWQLTGSLDLSVAADVYEIDGFDTRAEQVAALHEAGRWVVCYLNAGAYEPYRPDSADYPPAVLGRPMDGWPDERWLDIRRWDVLGPILTRRAQMCRAKGFDAVEMDNVDGYRNDTGFPLTAADQLAFNRRLAALLHEHGLAAGLKNDVEQVAALAPDFDFAVNEECFEFDECTVLRALTGAGKPVFHVEYHLSTEDFCAEAHRLGLSSMRKRPELDAWREPCVD